MPVVMESVHIGEEATMAPSSWRFSNQESSSCDTEGVTDIVAMETDDNERVSIGTAQSSDTLKHHEDDPYTAWTEHKLQWDSHFDIGEERNRSKIISSDRPASNIIPTSIVAKKMELNAALRQVNLKKSGSEASVDSLKNTLKNLTKIIKGIPSVQSETVVSDVVCSSHRIDPCLPPTKVRVTEVKDREDKRSHERWMSEEQMGPLERPRSQERSGPCERRKSHGPRRPNERWKSHGQRGTNEHSESQESSRPHERRKSHSQSGTNEHSESQESSRPHEPRKSQEPRQTHEKAQKQKGSLGLKTSEWVIRSRGHWESHEPRGLQEQQLSQEPRKTHDSYGPQESRRYHESEMLQYPSEPHNRQRLQEQMGPLERQGSQEGRRSQERQGTLERQVSQERDLWTAMSSLMVASPGTSSSSTDPMEELCPLADKVKSAEIRRPTALGKIPQQRAASVTKRSSTTTVSSHSPHHQSVLVHRSEGSRDDNRDCQTGPEIRTHAGGVVEPVESSPLSHQRFTDSMVSAESGKPPSRALFDRLLTPAQTLNPNQSEDLAMPGGTSPGSHAAVNTSAVNSTAVSMPTAVNLLKTMRQAVHGMRRSLADRRSSSPEISQRRYNIPKQPVVDYGSDDDELPDLDEPLGRVCTCTTSGQTKLMCRNCRLSPELGEPSAKKAKKDRHFLDVIPEPTKQSPPRHGHASKVHDHMSKVDEELADREDKEIPIHRRVRGNTRNDNQKYAADSRSVMRRSSRPPHFTIPLHGEMVFNSRQCRESQSLVQQIGDSEINLIEGVQEEAENSANLLPQVARLVQVFTTTKVEPPETLTKYLFDALCNSKDCRVSYELFNTLHNIVKLHPPMGSIPFTWEDLECVMERLRLPYGLKNIEQSVAVSNSLALQIICLWLETELLHRSLASQLRVIKSVAYRWVSAELSFSHVRAIIQWITQALMYGEYDDVLSGMRKLTLCRTEATSTQADTLVPSVLPSLQKLLDLSITVSKRPEECARRISIELVHMFHCLPSIQARHLFLSTLSSPLLKFTLTQRLLEDKCGAESCGAQCLQDIIQTDFRVDPPRTSLTPPPTPSSDDDDDDDMGRVQPLFHDEGWEELLLLLWTVVSSYLATAKAKLRYPLWKRELDKPAEVLDERDKRAVKDLPIHVQRLRMRIENTSPQISQQASLYLLKLECLSDMC